MKKTIRDIDVEGKRVFVRVDYNVPLVKVSGYPDEVFEPDADRAGDQGIHIPFLP